MSACSTNSSTGDQPTGSGTTSKIMSGRVVKAEKKTRSRSDPYPKNAMEGRKGGTRRESTPSEFGSEEEKLEWEKKRKMKDDHNVVEKRRREKINEHIVELGRLLPPSYIQSKNRGPILDAVQKYIEDFQAMQKCVETERVVELEKQIRELKKTIEMKEERISELTAQNIELNKIQLLNDEDLNWIVNEMDDFTGSGNPDLLVSPISSYPHHGSQVNEPTHINNPVHFINPRTDSFNTHSDHESVINLAGNRDATPHDEKNNSAVTGLNLVLPNYVQYGAYQSSGSSIPDQNWLLKY